MTMVVWGVGVGTLTSGGALMKWKITKPATMRAAITVRTI